MDPNESLKKARMAVRQWRTAKFDSKTELASGMELADAFEALDGWLCKGGFQPKDWDKK